MEANSACQPADMVAEVHDEARDHDGPEANGQRDVIVGRLLNEIRHGKSPDADRKTNNAPVNLRTFATSPEAPFGLPPRTDSAGNDDVAT
jgi:hypothetical protein